MSIPIVGPERRIVGWTETIPQVFGAALRHPEAERLVGGGIAALYIEILDPVDAASAGAPPNWIGAWRCLALCSESTVNGDPLSGAMPTIKIEPSRGRR